MSNSAKGLFVLVALIFALAFACNGIISMFRPQVIDPSKESINMVQPCTSPFGCTSRDERNAEHINLPNSEANRNNSEANLNNAQANQIQYETDKPKVDAALSFWIGVLVVIVLIVVGSIFIGVFVK